MISPQIDLTAHGDFSQSLDPVLVNSIIASEAMELADSVSMSIEDFEKEFAFEKIFGRRMYSNAFEIFHRHTYISASNIKQRCARCGKKLLPWKINPYEMNLCNRCEEDIYDRLPWGNKLFNAPSLVRDAREIFQMR